MLTEVEAVAAVGEEPIRSASCWPIDIRCRDAGGTESVVRVKPVNRREMAGVAIAEAVAWGILTACDLYVAQPYIVNISAQFAADLSVQGKYDPAIRAGRHWGTRLLNGVGLDKDFDRDQLRQIGRPDHIFRIFVIDELAGNEDRLTEGNLLLVTDRVLPARVIAIDQSNCFGGPVCICDRDCLAATRTRRYAHHYQVMERLLLDRPPEFVDQELALIGAHRDEILAAANIPHAEWYDGAGVTPDCIGEYLEARLDHLGELVRRDHWREICLIGQADAGRLQL